MKQAVPGFIDEDGAVLKAPADAAGRAYVFRTRHGLYETLRTYRGVPFLLERHLERLRHGATALGLVLPVSDTTVAARIEGLLTRYRSEAGQDAEATVRLILGSGEKKGGPTLTLTVTPHHPPPQEYFERGVAALISKSVQRDTRCPLAGLKSTDTARLTAKARKEAKVEGAYESLLLNTESRVAEGAYSNVLTLEGRTLLAIDPSEGPLPGVTQQLVLDLARGLGLSVETARLTPERLVAADEAMLTSSLAEVLPLVRVNGSMIGKGTPGPWSRRLLTAYREVAWSEGPNPPT